MPYGGDPANDPMDELRFLIGDTNPASELLSDGEVAYLIDRYGSVLAGAVAALEGLASHYAGRADVTIGKASKSFSQVSASYSRLAKDLRRRAGARGGIRATGIDRNQKRATRDDTSLVNPWFFRGQHSNPRVVGTDGWSEHDA